MGGPWWVSGCSAGPTSIPSAQINSMPLPSPAVALGPTLPPHPKTRRYMGSLRLTVAKGKGIVSLAGEPVLLGGVNSSNPVAQDPWVAKVIAPMTPAVDALRTQVGCWGLNRGRGWSVLYSLLPFTLPSSPGLCPCTPTPSPPPAPSPSPYHHR